MKVFQLFTLVLLLVTNELMAQENIFSLSYSFANTTGDMNEYISEPAYRGGSINYTRFLESNEHIGIGMSLDWQGFYQKRARESFPYYTNNSTVSQADINAVQFRYMYTTPIYAGIDYYPIKDKSFLPYVGANVGFTYTEQELYISAFDNEVNTSWDFAFGPEAGVHLVFGESGLGAHVIAKYNFSTYNYTFSSTQFETGMGSYFSVGVGLSFVMMNYYN